MNNSPQYNYSTQPDVPTNQGLLPLGTPPPQVSPQNEPRKQKRHYPRVPQPPPQGIPPQHQQPYQRQASPFQQQQRQQQGSPYQQPAQIPSFPRQASPFQPPQPSSPYQQQQLYQQQQQQPGYTSTVPQNSYVGNGVGYNQALNGMNQMNLSQPAARQDVSLVGQPALIQDLHQEIKTPSIPSNVSVLLVHLY